MITGRKNRFGGTEIPKFYGWRKNTQSTMQAKTNIVGLIARMRAHLEKCPDYASRNSSASTTSSRIQICENDSSDEGKKTAVLMECKSRSTQQLRKQSGFTSADTVEGFFKRLNVTIHSRLSRILREQLALSCESMQRAQSVLDLTIVRKVQDVEFKENVENYLKKLKKVAIALDLIQKDLCVLSPHYPNVKATNTNTMNTDLFISYLRLAGCELETANDCYDHFGNIVRNDVLLYVALRGTKR
ncbi:hypothetical protein EVAR_60093_1 [Eumeta japonica]|uniref:Uncharacterized protein n=1 Tax=Eumeta variegata TaxID=151549 RepID=A0A4C1YL27_EUMVA|nr:hypothetical protein EVAR_60093_1 [Eumeta japonica]